MTQMPRLERLYAGPRTSSARNRPSRSSPSPWQGEGAGGEVAAALCSDRRDDLMEKSTYNELTPQERYVIEFKGTEPPFTGEYDDFYEPGVYICRRCNAELYRSADKFDAHCGWPAFDQEISGAVRRL